MPEPIVTKLVSPIADVAAVVDALPMIGPFLSDHHDCPGKADFQKADDFINTGRNGDIS